MVGQAGGVGRLEESTASWRQFTKSLFRNSSLWHLFSPLFLFACDYTRLYVQERPVFYDFDEGRIIFLYRKTDFIFLSRKLDIIESGHCIKASKKKEPATSFYSIMCLWRDPSLQSWETWDIKMFVAIHVVLGLTYGNHLILFLQLKSNSPSFCYPSLRRLESE